MPKRKPTEKEEELDIKKADEQKKETFVTRWFKDYAVNNPSDLKIVCDLTARAAEEQFCMIIRSNNTEVYGVIFYATFLTILESIREKQKVYNNFTIEIANSINIGYSNNTDEDNEKVGNFMPIMEYIGINRRIVDTNTTLEADKTTANFIRWKELNIKKNIEYYKEIQERAFENLRKDYRTNIRTSEAIIPLFCIFMDHVVSVLKIKFQEAQGTEVSEVSMNVFGLFDVYYSFNPEENQEIIEFSPNIRMKLALKNDNAAGKE